MVNMDTSVDMHTDRQLDKMVVECIENIDKSNKDLMRKRGAETDDILAKLQKPTKKHKTVARKRKPQASNEMVIENAETDDEHDQKPLRCKKGVDTKTSPSKVYTLFQELKENQKKKIEYFKNTAFGHFADLNIGRLPSQLALNLLESYDPVKQIIRLDEGRSIRVCARNVHDTLGLPMGEVNMLVKPANISTESVEEMKQEFLKQFGEENRQTVKLHKLRDLILKGEVGPNFVRNLILYISTSILFCRGNDNVVLDIIPHLQDINRIHELNWCEYVMDKLAETKENFNKSSKKSYNGPLLFLILHYVDMVVVTSRKVKRTRPSFLPWTTPLLNQRQDWESSNGFGTGLIADDIPQPTVAYVERNKDQEKPQTEPNMVAQQQNIDPEQHNKEPVQPKDIV